MGFPLCRISKYTALRSCPPLLPAVPMGRAGTAHEVAEAVIWLLSPEASYVTDSFVDVAGAR